MSDQQELLSENLSVKKVRVLRRRNDRMKLSFNLTKDEATAFSNFFKSVNVNGHSEEEFIKTAFILELRSMETTTLHKMKEELEKAQQTGEASEAVEFVEEEDDTEKTEE